jgi:hypothetical protein
LFVALVANRGLFGNDRDRIVLSVYPVAAHAGDIFPLMNAALPADAMTTLMTT